MKRARYFFLFSLVFLHIFGSFAQSYRSQAIDISILTCAPGKETYSTYGHNALRVVDHDAQTDLVYNWGTFDFDEPGFLIKFLRGKLPYMLSVSDMDQFLLEYEYFHRSVTEQRIFLDSTDKMKIMKALQTNLLPHNRTYKYDFFIDNCATRIRDIIVFNIGHLDWKPEILTEKTFRNIIKEYQAPNLWTDFGIDLIIGARADVKVTASQASFIPDYLARSFKQIRYTDNGKKKLLLEEQKIISYPLDNKISLWQRLLSPLMFFMILLLWEINLYFRDLQNRLPLWVKKYDHLWIFILTLVSFIMCVMWFLTDHIPTKDNWNIMWASPLIFFWWLMRSRPVGQVLLWIILLGYTISALNVLFTFLPQYFHPCVALICCISGLKLWRMRSMSA